MWGLFTTENNLADTEAQIFLNDIEKHLYK